MKKKTTTLKAKVTKHIKKKTLLFCHKRFPVEEIRSVCLIKALEIVLYFQDHPPKDGFIFTLFRRSSMFLQMCWQVE